tara:strand:- start:56 stop:421 length:366 start_codon:yes stop_codon:yes gene_type:complete
MQAFRVGFISDFKNRDKKVVVVDKEEIGVFRIDDNFYAWKNICPHQGGPVCQGRLYPLVKENLDEFNQSHGRIYDENNLNIVCPWHGLEFDVRTGKHPGNQNLSLSALPIKIESESVYVLI